MMSQVDEIEKDRHINMTFVEFLEAIVRVAEKAEIPHCKLVSTTLSLLLACFFRAFKGRIHDRR